MIVNANNICYTCFNSQSPPRLLIKSFEAWSDDDEPPVKGTNAAKKAQETWTAGFFMG